MVAVDARVVEICEPADKRRQASQDEESSHDFADRLLANTHWLWLSRWQPAIQEPSRPTTPAKQRWHCH